MTKQELLNKYPVDILSEVQFVEEQVPNYPIWKKQEMIANFAKCDINTAKNALKDYQQFMEI